MKKQQRIIGLMLAILICLQLIPFQVFAYETNEKSTDVLPTIITTDSDGQKHQTEYDESWEEYFPTGTFAFGFDQSDVIEGGSESISESIILPVYRLGGTEGKAVVWVDYHPAKATELKNEELGEAYAASGRDDIRINVENPLSRSIDDNIVYPAVSDALIDIDEGEIGSVNNDTTVYVIDKEAQRYQWQIEVRMPDDGSLYTDWTDVPDAQDASIEIPNEIIWHDTYLYDFRCVYVADGVEYCTDPIWGDKYEVPEQPNEDMFALNNGTPCDDDYTTLNFTEEYDSCMFPIVFADGEWVKNIALPLSTTRLPNL